MGTFFVPDTHAGHELAAFTPGGTSMRIRSVVVAGLALTLGLAAGCSSGSDSSKTGPTQQSQPKTTVASPASETATPPLPGELPKFTDGSDVEPAMQQLIQLAVQHAVGISDQDRQPAVTVTSDSSCGVRVASDVCPPTSNKEEVVIYINPTIAWSNYQQSNTAGGDAPWQNAVIASVINYVMFRETQRNNPGLLTDQSDSAASKVRKIQLCKTGNIAGPLRRAMSPQLAAMYAPYDKYPDYRAGAEGKC